MAKKLPKSLRTYFSKLKKIRTTMSLPTTPTTSSLLSACKYPKTSSFALADRRGGDDDDAAHAATLSDVDRFLFENFQSLYINDAESHHPSPDAAKPSGRFSASASTTSDSPADDDDDHPAVAAAESVAVVTFSRDPYEDFRRSMQEMVDARHVRPGQPLDWDFVGELLLCYLDLNDRAVHKHILRAFADLTVSFRRRMVPPGRPTTTTRRRRKKACDGGVTSLPVVD